MTDMPAGSGFERSDETITRDLKAAHSRRAEALAYRDAALARAEFADNEALRYERAAGIERETIERLLEEKSLLAKAESIVGN